MDRFEHRLFSQSIKDNLTGYLHSDLKDITDLLNKIHSNRMETQEMAIEIFDENNKINNVMKKYGISSVEELDHILFYARVW